jgi:hypothetical protein
VLRSVTLSVAVSVLAAACALVEPPVPPGTTPIQVEVHNLSDAPVGELGVKVRQDGGTLLHAAQPPSVPEDSTATVTFHVPANDEWWIAVNGIGLLEGRRFERFGRDEACLIEFSGNMDLRLRCERVAPPPPAGTRAFQVEVQNPLPDPVELTITTPDGVLPGAVQPASLPALSETIVTFQVPIRGEWARRGRSCSPGRAG